MAVKEAVKNRTDSRVREPGQFCVIMFNDDFTTMDFVVEVLVDIFHKEAAEARSIMLTVHRKGQAVVGRYSYDIAATKVHAALSRAKASGYPFRMTIEEV